MKHFWKKAGIRMIVIDATHTKLLNFRHIILLLAVTFDANNKIVILSFASCWTNTKEAS